jgi:hypothetical protein
MQPNANETTQNIHIPGIMIVNLLYRESEMKTTMLLFHASLEDADNAAKHCQRPMPMRKCQ